MNIVKLQNELKSVPDDALIGYVQNPTGQVPSYLALSELQRRKEMRAKYQAAQPEKTTVAEDLAAPQGIAAMQQPAETPVAEPGVAGLPVPDQMFSGQGMAAGGIVAFDDGGYVLPSDYDPDAYLADYQQELLGIPSYVAGEQLPGEGARKAKKELQRKAKTPYDAAIAYYEGLPKPMISSTPTYLNPENVLRREREKWFEQKGSIAQDKKITDTQDKKQQTQQNIDKAIADSKIKPTPGGGGITSVLPKPMTLDEAIQREKDAYRKMGVDENFYTDQAKKLQEEREALKGEKSQAGWMALAKAGLGMAAGKSPFALQNIATGAMQGIEQYGVDVKDLKKEQNLLRASDQKLAEAQYLQSRGDAQGALKAMDEREKLLAQAQQHKETIAAHIQSAQISAGAKSGMAQLPALYKVLASTTDPAQQKQIQDRIDAILVGEGNVPSGPTKTPTKPLSSFGG
jgi:hypothetical protein